MWCTETYYVPSIHAGKTGLLDLLYLRAANPAIP